MHHFFSKTTAIALIFIGAAHAQTIDHGTYSVDYSASSHLFLKGLPGFSNTYFSMGGDGTLYGDKSGSIQANFHAASGKVFDKLIFFGTGGLFAFNEAGTTFSQLTWSITPTPTFTGDTFGGVINNERSNYWEITSPSTGRAYYSKSLTNNFTTEDGVGSNVSYDIGVADFSINLDSLISAPGTSAISVQTIGFGVTFRDAPLISSAVPEPEAYAMLLAGFGLMSAIARRRKAKRAA